LQKPPKAPVNLKALAQNDGTVSLAWDQLTGNITGINIYRSAGDTLDWSLAATLAANQTSYTDSGLQNHVQYFYRITASDQINESDYSNIVSVTVDNASIQDAYHNPLLLYPNPASDHFEINVEGLTGNYTLTIVNNLGELIAQQVISNPKNRFIYHLPELARGIYTIRLYNTEHVYSSRLMIAH
jgi:hypothetical protein